MASFAGFFPATVPLAELGFELPVTDVDMLIAEPGRAKGIGLAPPGFEDGVNAELGPFAIVLGCCRMANTKVLFSASR